MRSSSIIDLSHAIDDDVPVYPGDPSFHCRQTSRVPDNGWSVHELKFSSHVGTHIDAPSHRFEGKSSIDAISLSSFVRPALVIDVSGKDAGSSIDLVDFQPHESKVKEGMAVLFRTGWDQYWTDKPGKYFEHPYIKRAVAERLVDLGVAIIGVDTMSPDPISEADDELGVHDVVLGAGRLIAENLTNLAALQTAQDNAPDRTPMVCLAPLKFVGCDGSPVRAFGWHGVSLPRRFTFNSCRKTPPVTKQLPGLFIVALTRVCGMIPRPALPSLLPEHKSATIGWFKRLPQFSPELPTPMRTIIDLSHLLSSSGGSFCDGHPRYACEPCCTIESDGSAVSRLSLSSHTGTHIDAPAHFIPGGSSVDAIDLSQLVCPAVIIDARGYDPNSYLDWDDTFAPYEEQFKPGVAVLVCTGWSRHWNTTIYSRNPRIAVDTARRIADRGVRVLGIDALSPDGIPEKSEVVKHEVHLEWLGRGGVIAENLSNLETLLEDGSARWMVSLLPLRLDRCDGSPIRAVAWRE